MRMNLLEREIAPNQPDPTGIAPKEEFHRRCRLLAVRALKVAVLHDYHRRMRWPEIVVRRIDGERQFERAAHQRPGASPLRLASKRNHTRFSASSIQTSS